MAERNAERFKCMQSMVLLRSNASAMLQCFGHEGLHDPLELCAISKVYLCPDEIVMPYNKLYIIIAFDYEPQRTGMDVVKITERYTTTHFKEKISLN